jgi:hypothetical protein
MSLISYIKLTETLDNSREISLYFSPIINFTTNEMNDIINSYIGENGIIDKYYSIFPQRKIVISIEKLLNLPNENENTNIITIKNNNKFINYGIIELLRHIQLGLFKNYFLSDNDTILSYYTEQLWDSDIESTKESDNEYKCPCYCDGCPGDCGTLWCGCIDVCRGRCGLGDDRFW